MDGKDEQPWNRQKRCSFGLSMYDHV